LTSVGIDLHRKRSHDAVLAEDGTQLLSRRIANEPQMFLELGRLVVEHLKGPRLGTLATGSTLSDAIPANVRQARVTLVASWRLHDSMKRFKRAVSRRNRGG